MFFREQLFYNNAIFPHFIQIKDEINNKSLYIWKSALNHLPRKLSISHICHTLFLYT